MMGHHFDTHQMVKHFMAEGFKEKQAEAIIDAITQSREFDVSQLATKTDLAKTQSELENKIVVIKAELKQEISGLRTEMHEMKNDLLKWMIGMQMTAIFGLAGVMITVLKFML